MEKVCRLCGQPSDRGRLKNRTEQEWLSGEDSSQKYVESVWDSPYSTTERRVPELIPVLGSQPAGDVSHKPGGGLPLLAARPAVTLATLKRASTNFAAW